MNTACSGSVLLRILTKYLFKDLYSQLLSENFTFRMATYQLYSSFKVVLHGMHKQNDLLAIKIYDWIMVFS